MTQKFTKEEVRNADRQLDGLSRQMLNAYAATLRQQAEQAGGAVSEAAVDWLIAYRARLIVDGMHPDDANAWMQSHEMKDWEFDAHPVACADAAFQDFFEQPEAAAPLLRAPAESPCSLSEALNVIERWADHGNKLHGDDVPRLRATINRIAPVKQSGRVDAADAAEKWLQSTARKAGPHGVSADQEAMMRLGFLNGYEAALAAQGQPATPILNIRCESVASDGVKGSTYLPVVRVEAEDDGSFTAVTSYWPAEPAQDNYQCMSCMAKDYGLQPTAEPAQPASPAGVPELVRYAIERCLRSQEALVASIDKANPDDPYASALVAEDIEYLRAWLAAAPSQPEDAA